MIENLEYRFHKADDTHRVGFLEIGAPKLFIDYVRSSQGAMHDEVNSDPARGVIKQTYDGDGGLNLGFDLDMHGLGWRGQAADRAIRALAAIQQLNMVAHRRGIADPRINFTPPLGIIGPVFKVSFVRPDGDEETTAAKIGVGMLEGAISLRRVGEKRDEREYVRATYSAAAGFSLYSRRESSDPILSSTLYEEPGNHLVELVSDRTQGAIRKEAPARLIALIGIISALDPIHSPEN